jgi:hypothetical protein
MVGGPIVRWFCLLRPGGMFCAPVARSARTLRAAGSGASHPFLTLVRDRFDSQREVSGRNRLLSDVGMSAAAQRKPATSPGACVPAAPATD